MSIGAGSDLAFACPASVAVDVFTGPVAIGFLTVDGAPVTVTLGDGYSLVVETPDFIFDPQIVTVVAPPTNPGPIVVTVAGQDQVLEPGEQTAHSDGDGIPDDADACPASDLSPTVVIGDCDSGVSNQLFPYGCTISDEVAICADAARNHGQFVSCVAKTANSLKKDGIITVKEQAAIKRCAAKADIP